MSSTRLNTCALKPVFRSLSFCLVLLSWFSWSFLLLFLFYSIFSFHRTPYLILSFCYAVILSLVSPVGCSLFRVPSVSWDDFCCLFFQFFRACLAVFLHFVSWPPQYIPPLAVLFLFVHGPFVFTFYSYFEYNIYDFLLARHMPGFVTAGRDWRVNMRIKDMCTYILTHRLSILNSDQFDGYCA